MGSLNRHSADQLEELVSRDQTIEVLVCPFNHVLEILLGDIATDVMGNTAEVLHADESSLLSVEESEDAVDVFFRVPFQQAGSHQVDELFEGDAAVPLSTQVYCQLIDGLVAGLWAERSDGILNF
jgi:hypothetical protein